MNASDSVRELARLEGEIELYRTEAEKTTREKWKQECLAKVEQAQDQHRTVLEALKGQLLSTGFYVQHAQGHDQEPYSGLGTGLRFTFPFGTWVHICPTPCPQVNLSDPDAPKPPHGPRVSCQPLSAQIGGVEQADREDPIGKPGTQAVVGLMLKTHAWVVQKSRNPNWRIAYSDPTAQAPTPAGKPTLAASTGR